MQRFTEKCQEQSFIPMKVKLKETMPMKSIKKILLGIAIMIFGFGSIYVGALTNWMPAQVIGFFTPIIGLGLSVVGYFDKED